MSESSAALGAFLESGPRGTLRLPELRAVRTDSHHQARADRILLPPRPSVGRRRNAAGGEGIVAQRQQARSRSDGRAKRPGPTGASRQNRTPKLKRNVLGVV